MVALALLMLLGQRHGFSQASGTITPALIHSLEVSVEDEVYDNGFEEEYVGAGTNDGAAGAKWISRMPIYVNPQIDQGVGRAVYDLKHYGEIYRAFYFRDDGMVVLDGDAEKGFPPSDASFEAKYMDRDRLVRLKRDWLHETFVINTDPDIRMVREAAARQRERTGASYWEEAILPHLSKQ